jgi:pyruvate,water dikinase
MPRDSLELLLGLPAGSEQPGFSPTPETFRLLPGMVAMGGRLSRYGAVVDRTLPVIDEVYAWFAHRDLMELSDEQLLNDVEALRAIGVEAARLNVVTPLLANAYGTLLRSQLSRLGIDATALRIEDSGDASTDPNAALAELGAAIAAHPDGAAAATTLDDLPPDLRREFDAFLDRFGHFSDSGNDFSIPPWRETPATLVTVASAHTPSNSPTARIDWDDVESRIPGWRRPAIAALKRTASAYAHRRDVVSSRYTYGYGLFRPYFLEIGRRLAATGALREPTDVWYLTVDELAETLRTPTDRSDIVSGRRAEMEALRDASMPELVFGDDFVPSPGASDGRRMWSGKATARGHHRGPARVVEGLSDFDRVRDGDVLVIPYSDVGWTPLFAKAGAVVAEAGGMLSHSSIVAREYGIPCVVSVTGALEIPDGAIVVVDGYTGIVDVES